MKRFTLFTALTFCILLLAGCVGNTNKEPSSTEKQSGQEPASTEEHSTEMTEPTEEHSDEKHITETGGQQFSDNAATSIAVLREEIGQSTALFGVAYIGYFDGTFVDETGIDFGQWFYAASSPLTESCPFVSEIDADHTIGAAGHLYCVIAEDREATICVSRKGDKQPLYTAQNGDPILLFCNLDGDAQNADTVVTIKTADGTEYRWEPTLDDMGLPNFVVSEERELLSWDFTPIADTGFDLEGWIVEGWGGPTAAGLAWDSNGLDWWISTWDGSVSYCLSFYRNETDGCDGEAVLECFYADEPAVQARWQGQWRIDTEMEQPSRLHLELTLKSGADRAAFAYAATVSESYLAMVPQSGDYLLLVADAAGAMLPIFPDGVQAVELARAEG